jgi:hypothetical protein
MRIVSLAFFTAFAFIVESRAASTAPFFGDNPCGSNLTLTNCAIIIKNADLDNISASMVTGGGNPGNRVDLRDRSTPDTYYWFTSGDDASVAKSALATLLTAKATGSNVKLWITWSAGTGTSRQFSAPTIVDP